MSTATATAPDTTTDGSFDITVRIGQMSASVQTVTGNFGMTIREAFSQVGIDLDRVTASVRGEPRDLDEPLQDNDLVMASRAVRGG